MTTEIYSLGVAGQQLFRSILLHAGRRLCFGSQVCLEDATLPVPPPFTGATYTLNTIYSKIVSRDSVDALTQLLDAFEGQFKEVISLPEADRLPTPELLDTLITHFNTQALSSSQGLLVQVLGAALKICLFVKNSAVFQELLQSTGESAAVAEYRRYVAMILRRSYIFFLFSDKYQESIKESAFQDLNTLLTLLSPTSGASTELEKGMRAIEATTLQSRQAQMAE